MSSSTSIVTQRPSQEEAVSPQRHDEEWAGGQMPGADSDDSVDELVEEMDLYQKDEDGVEELDIAEEVNQAERNRHFDAE